MRGCLSIGWGRARRKADGRVRRVPRGLALAGLLAGLLLLGAGPQLAGAQGGPTFPGGPPTNTYFVGTTDDVSNSANDCSANGNTDCSLRDAIDAATGDQDLDLIEVPAGTYNLTAGPLDVEDGGGVSIVGEGDTPADTVVQPGIDHDFQVLRIQPADSSSPVPVELQNLTVSGGKSSSGVDGGNISVTGGDLFATDVVVSDGSSGGNGGGIFVDDESASSFLSGSDLQVVENSADGNGGGIFADTAAGVELVGSVVDDNTAASEGDGGGLYLEAGSSTVTSVDVAGNSATDGGGVYVSVFDTAAVTFVGPSVSSNTASAGAGIFLSEGGLVLTDSADGEFVAGSAVTNNTADSGDGGGLYLESDDGPACDDSPSSPFVCVTDTTVAGNTATNGGGIYNAEAVVSVTNSVIGGADFGNQASAGSGEAEGGGIYNANSMTVEGSTISDNSATAGEESNAAGGGIYNENELLVENSTVGPENTLTAPDGTSTGAGIDNESSATLLNDTIADNSGATNGGGLAYNVDSGQALTVTNVTISGNSASDSGGGFYDGLSAVAAPTLTGVILAGDTAGGDADECGGFRSVDLDSASSFNIDAGSTCDFAGLAPENDNLSNTDPQLAAGGLAENGGPTETIALDPGSPAIGLEATGCPGTDQRGVVRPEINCDAGAFQAAAQAPAVTSGSAGALTTTTADLDGTVNAEGQQATAFFEYGTTTAYGSSTGSTVVTGDRSDHQVGVGLTGLSPGTTYHFRLVATNNAGTTNGEDETFTTVAAASGGGAPGPSLPSVGTATVTTVSSSTATVNASIDPNGSDTLYSVYYGPTTSYGNQTGLVDLGAGTTAATVSVTIGGLAPSTTYHFEFVAQNGIGATSSPDATFTTAVAPGPVTTVAAGQLPPPVSGQSVDVTPFLGTVLVNGVPLVAGQQIPVGSIVDTRNGTVVLQSVAPDGSLQQAQFAGAVFRITQAPGGITVLTLVNEDFSVCTATHGVRKLAKKATIVASLWGNGEGKFETKGRYAAATVRGTIWHTLDLCTGTEVVVRRGTVAVQDLVTHKTILVTAPHFYLAKP